jgi:hypothetical protein
MAARRPVPSHILSRRRIVTNHLLGALIAGWTLAPAFALSQPCTGDCNDDNTVAVNEVIVGVGIALDALPLSRCPSFDVGGDNRVDISELVLAVGDVLNGCGSVTPTPTPSPSPTPTSGPPDVSGSWREDQYALVSSTCNATLTAQVFSEVSQPPVCDYGITQDGASVTGVDCNDNSVPGTVDASGTMRFETQQSMTEQGCTIGQSLDLSIAASHSPTSALGTFRFTFSGQCAPFFDCTIVIRSRWTKL